MALSDPTQSGEGAAAAIPAPIIVKKVTIQAAGHHGGAWKVAYADFVTAMMAFFLLLWLLGATEEKQRKGIADYFTPTLVKMRKESAGSDGLLGGSSITDADNYPNAMGQTGTRAITIPRGVTGGPVEGGGRGEMDSDKLKELRDKIEKKLVQRRQLSHLARQVRVMRAPEGIRIDLVDDADFSMFELGTTILTQEARGLLGVMAETLDGERAPLILRGHTDSLPWRSGVAANNWSLSTGRAEATRQALVLSGLPARQIARIEGVAETEPLIADNPADPRNRRISLLLIDGKAGGKNAGIRARPRVLPKLDETAAAAAGKAAPAS
ncbi:flagellar motor protein MotB [Erythrobacter sanguineus]|uniref:Chemotaxis protein MotB n=1 Tax=Erythrobacter sanguineus TaxID=198312 RepID=A0A1M7SFP0_9SPHN|nr:flagellar motor protein MotB [Erythrobacter sanguineus]SHN57112.1 chemotaxis protein MotB [Erythrobacter sanguineus]